MRQPPLSGYIFDQATRVLEKSISDAVSYCKKQNILKDFFENFRPEEANMLATEWHLEDALRVREEEAWEKGRNTFSNLMNQAKSMDQLKKLFEASFP
jgi:hypothetical protein